MCAKRRKAILVLTLTTLKDFCINYETKRVFQFEIIINVLVSSFCFLLTSMLWVYDYYTLFTSYGTEIEFRRHNLTSIDVRFWPLKSKLSWMVIYALALLCMRRMYIYMNIALRRLLHNHGNISTEGSSKPGLFPTLISNEFKGSL